MELLHSKGLKSIKEIKEFIKPGDLVRISEQALIQKGLIPMKDREKSKSEMRAKWTSKLYTIQYILPANKLSNQTASSQFNEEASPRFKLKELPKHWFLLNQLQIITPLVGSKVWLKKPNSNEWDKTKTYEVTKSEQVYKICELKDMGWFSFKEVLIQDPNIVRNPIKWK